MIKQETAPDKRYDPADDHNPHVLLELFCEDFYVAVPCQMA